MLHAGPNYSQFTLSGRNSTIYNLPTISIYFAFTSTEKILYDQNIKRTNVYNNKEKGIQKKRVTEDASGLVI